MTEKGKATKIERDRKKHRIDKTPSIQSTVKTWFLSVLSLRGMDSIPYSKD